MAEEPRATSEQEIKSADETRILGSVAPSSRPRVLKPVEPNEIPEVSGFDAIPRDDSSSHLTLPRSANEVANANSRSGVHTDVLSEALRISRSALEGILSKTHAIHEESWQAVQSLFENLHLRLCQECDNRVARFEQEIRDRGRYETATLLEILQVEAESRLAAHVDQALDKAHEAEIHSTQQLNKALAAGCASLTETADTAIQELQQQKTVCLRDLEAEGQRRLRDLNSQHRNEFENSIRQTADTLGQKFTKETDDALLSFQERLPQIAEEITARLEKKLTTLTEIAVARVSTEVQTIVSRETSVHLIDTLRRRLDQLASSLDD